MTIPTDFHHLGQTEPVPTLAGKAGLNGRLLQRCIRPFTHAFLPRRTLRAVPTDPVVEEQVRLRTQSLEQTVVALRDEIGRLKVAEREAARMRATADAAEAANHTCLAELALEIRTLTHGIAGLSNRLLDTPLNPEQADVVETLHRAGERLLTMINDMLHLSKIDTGNVRLEKTEFDLSEELQLSLDVHADAAARKGVDLVMDIDSDVPTRVKGDPLRLREVVLNLISNALKFTERGGIALGVRLERALPEGCRVRFCVTDTGVGMPEGVKSGLFQPPAIDPSSCARNIGGTGLAIARRLVTLMGGEMGVISSVGAGSTFWFSVEFEHAREAVRGATPTPSPLAGQHVLIVDDNYTNRKLFGHLAAAWGMIPGMADSGESALARLREAARRGQPYGLVVLDHHIAGRERLALARSILADATIPRPRLIILTSRGERLRRSEMDAHGIAACEGKPIHPKKLYATLTRVLSAPYRSVREAASAS